MADLTIEELAASLTHDTVDADADTIAVFDSDAAVTKKMTVEELQRSTSQIITLADEGVYADSGVDETSAISAVMTAIAANHAGYLLYAPRGEYLVSDLAIQANLTLFGDPWGTTFKAYDAATNGIFTHSAPRSTIKDIILDGNRDGPYANNGVKLMTTDAWGIVYDNVQFRNMTLYGMLDAANSTTNHIYRCTFQGGGDLGCINFTNFQLNTKIEHCNFQHGGVDDPGLPFAIKVAGGSAGDGVLIDNCWFEFSGTTLGSNYGAGGDNDVVDCVQLGTGYSVVRNSRFEVGSAVPGAGACIRFLSTAAGCKEENNTFMTLGAAKKAVIWDSGSTYCKSDHARKMQTKDNYTDSGTGSLVNDDRSVGVQGYTYATLPDAQQYDDKKALVATSDGDGGLPGLAVTNGSEWHALKLRDDPLKATAYGWKSMADPAGSGIVAVSGASHWKTAQGGTETFDTFDGYYYLAFTGGGAYEILVGHTITGATSSATGVVTYVSVTSGTWVGGDAAGVIRFRVTTGTFSAGGENLDIGANLDVATTSAGLQTAEPEFGQKIVVKIADTTSARSYFDFVNGNLRHNTYKQWVGDQEDVMTCTYDGTYWLCDIHSDNQPKSRAFGTGSNIPVSGVPLIMTDAGRTEGSNSLWHLPAVADCHLGQEYIGMQVGYETNTCQINPDNADHIEGYAAGVYLQLETLNGFLHLKYLGLANTWHIVASSGTISEGT